MNISNKDKDTLIGLGKKNSIKLVWQARRVYNSLCPKCKIAVITLIKRNPGKASDLVGNLSLYCEECQNKIKEVFKNDS